MWCVYRQLGSTIHYLILLMHNPFTFGGRLLRASDACPPPPNSPREYWQRNYNCFQSETQLCNSKGYGKCCARDDDTAYGRDINCDTVDEVPQQGVVTRSPCVRAMYPGCKHTEIPFECSPQCSWSGKTNPYCLSVQRIDTCGDAATWTDCYNRPQCVYDGRVKKCLSVNTLVGLSDVCAYVGECTDSDQQCQARCQALVDKCNREYNDPSAPRTAFCVALQTKFPMLPSTTCAALREACKTDKGKVKSVSVCDYIQSTSSNEYGAIDEEQCKKFSAVCDLERMTDSPSYCVAKTNYAC